MQGTIKAHELLFDACSHKGQKRGGKEKQRDGDEVTGKKKKIKCEAGKRLELRA